MFKTDSLFANAPKYVPLAEKMRPRTLEEFIGQANLVGSNSYLARLISKDNLQSLILYGPAGVGKTTLANIIANTTKDDFEKLNATIAGVSDLRQIIQKAKELRQLYSKRTILFLDEIHRFNKAQQDILLPYIENGLLILIGATTENPYFEINTPLLSRVKVLALQQLEAKHIKQIIEKALRDNERGLGSHNFSLTDDSLCTLADFSNGDARIALNLLEQLYLMFGENTCVTLDELKIAMPEAIRRYDKNGDQHYNVVSAFIKSMRGSDVNASIHYLARMLAAGENIEYIARRIIICAAEDVGLADPQALTVATSCFQAIKILGMPEARIPLAQAVAYIALAPKSNACYLAIDKALQDLNTIDCGDVPAHLKDAHYAGAQNLGWGLDYKYPHDYPNNYVSQQYLPDNLKGKIYLATNNLTPKEI